MTPLYRKITLALGVVLTLAMIQTSDAQLFRFRRNACPPPAASQCCSQNNDTAVATEVAYEAPQTVVSQAVLEPATTTPVVEQEYFPIVYAQPIVEQSAQVIDYPIIENPIVDYPIIDSNVVPTVFESTPSPTPVPDESGLVISGSAPGDTVSETQTSVLAPVAQPQEEILLASPAPTPAAESSETVSIAPTPTPEPVPVPVAAEQAGQPLVAPGLPEAVDAAKAKAEEAVGESILK